MASKTELFKSLRRLWQSHQQSAVLLREWTTTLPRCTSIAQLRSLLYSPINQVCQGWTCGVKSRPAHAAHIKSESGSGLGFPYLPSLQQALQVILNLKMCTLHSLAYHAHSIHLGLSRASLSSTFGPNRFSQFDAQLLPPAERVGQVIYESRGKQHQRHWKEQASRLFMSLCGLYKSVNLWMTSNPHHT